MEILVNHFFEQNFIGGSLNDIPSAEMIKAKWPLLRNGIFEV